MSIAQIEILLIASTVAVAAALPGVFLVLRRMAMMSDAISHSILLGIVIAFFFVHDLSNPLLVAGATLMGVATVGLVELLNRTGRMHEDSAMGLVFPLLFSIGVILISKYAGNVHLDTDAVLMGELAFAPFDRLMVGGVDIGPRSLWVMGGILLMNVAFIAVFYKEIKLATFDAGLAAALGFSPVFIHYALMTMVSVTAVGAFDAVGALLVVALMIAPATAAYLLTDRLLVMLLLAALIGVISAVSGFAVATWLDVSIAGCMAGMTGVVFLLVFLFAPERGMVAILLRREKQKAQFAGDTLTIHLLNHDADPVESEERKLNHLGDHLRWEPLFAKRVVRYVLRRGFVEQQGEYLFLTKTGRQNAKAVMTSF